MALRPKKLVILERLTDHLEGMATADGYSADMMGRISRGKEVLGDESKPPWISIIQGPRPEIWDDVGDDKVISKGPWLLFIQGWAKSENTKHPTDEAEWLLADTQKRLAMIAEENVRGRPVYPDLYLLGRLVHSLTIGPGVVRGPDKQNTTRAGFYLPVIIEADLDYRQPFIDV